MVSRYPRSTEGITRTSVVVAVFAGLSGLAFVGLPLLLAGTGGSSQPPVFSEGGKGFGDHAVRSEIEARTAPSKSEPTTESSGAPAAASPEAAGSETGSRDDRGASGTTAEGSQGPDTATDPPRRADRREADGGTERAGAAQEGPSEALQPPTTGRYQYAVEGWESTSAPGSRRNFPSTATVAVHNRRQQARGTSVTVDLTYSDSHEERMVLRYGREDVAVTFEGGRVSFFGGAVTETSQARYEPPMVLLPTGAAPGDTWSGNAEARDPDDGSVARRVSYQGRVRGTEELTVAGRRLSTVVVEWSSEFTGSESGWRRQRLWFSPQLGMWVKRHDRVHAERYRFAYDKDATLTLRQFPG